MIRVYVGCGSSPIKGWLNFDNSLTVRLARYPLLPMLVCRTPMRKEFVRVVKSNNIKWADATKRIPVPDSSVDVLYTCHMMEHLDQEEVQAFLREVHRVMKPKGIFRVVVPDIRQNINKYLHNGDANEFIAHTFLTETKPKTLKGKLLHLLNGHRNHHWMYDSASMVALLVSAQFSQTKVLEPGITTISDPGELDLFERNGESLYVEARV